MISFITEWYSHPLFLRAIRERIQEGLVQFSTEERKRVHLIFTAHSLPKSIIEQDPYTKELKTCVKGCLKGLILSLASGFSEQGRRIRGVVGPDVESILIDLSNQTVSGDSHRSHWLRLRPY